MPTADRGYAGQYRDSVRVVATEIGPGRRVYGYVLRDARGRVLGTADGPDTPPLEHVGTILRVPGAPRRIVVWGLLAHASDHVAVRLAGGREVAAHVKALPAAIRRTSGAAAALAVRAAPRRLIVRGPDRGSQALVLPPAAEQCGYSTYHDLRYGDAG